MENVLTKFLYLIFQIEATIGYKFDVRGNVVELQELYFIAEEHF